VAAPSTQSTPSSPSTGTHHPSITCHPFTAADIEAAHALSLELRWPHRAEDWRFAAAFGPGFVAKDGDRLVGTALCWPYGEHGATLGLVIVAPDQQGKGIGRMLMERVLDTLGPRMTMLHATAAGQPLYEKLGFKKIGLLHQHQGVDFRVPPVELLPGEHLRPLAPADTPRLIELATRASGLDRSALLPPLLDIAQGVALVRDDTLLGFALLRPFGRGHAIGPVVAVAQDGDPIRRAQALIADRLAANAGAFTRIDTPDENGLSDWLDSIGLARVDTVVKMARNGEPLNDPAVLQFGIVNQALG
jgi:GNAT superfamily N-acetyltransferase